MRPPPGTCGDPLASDPPGAARHFEPPLQVAAGGQNGQNGPGGMGRIIVGQHLTSPRRETGTVADVTDWHDGDPRPPSLAPCAQDRATSLLLLRLLRPRRASYAAVLSEEKGRTHDRKGFGSFWRLTHLVGIFFGEEDRLLGRPEASRQRGTDESGVVTH